MSIDFEKFKSKYWKPTQGCGHNVMLTNWHEETRAYEGETGKPVMVFEVLKVDNVDYDPGAKIFVTSAASFAEGIQPIIERAEDSGKTGVEVYIEYGRDNQYLVADLALVRGVVKGHKINNATPPL